ncbi:hypothetical protein PV326_000532, partial [Microctonus aethiopoides]
MGKYDHPSSISLYLGDADYCQTSGELESLSTISIVPSPSSSGVMEKINGNNLNNETTSTTSSSSKSKNSSKSVSVNSANIPLPPPLPTQINFTSDGNNSMNSSRTGTLKSNKSFESE